MLSDDDSSKNPGSILLSKHDEIVKKCPQNATFLGHDIQDELVLLWKKNNRENSSGGF